MRPFFHLDFGRVESVHNYPGALIPLEQAHLHSHSARSASRTQALAAYEEDIALDELNYDGEAGEASPAKEGDSESQGMLPQRAGEYTIAGLRRAVRQGGKDKWTEYELKSKLISKAIQDIGMGSYNWQLFVLCGFGWFADK